MQTITTPDGIAAEPNLIDKDFVPDELDYPFEEEIYPDSRSDPVQIIRDRELQREIRDVLLKINQPEGELLTRLRFGLGGRCYSRDEIIKIAHEGEIPVQHLENLTPSELRALEIRLSGRVLKTIWRSRYTRDEENAEILAQRGLLRKEHTGDRVETAILSETGRHLLLYGLGIRGIELKPSQIAKIFGGDNNGIRLKIRGFVRLAKHPTKSRSLRLFTQGRSSL